jgi:hypothetical protein
MLIENSGKRRVDTCTRCREPIVWYDREDGPSLIFGRLIVPYPRPVYPKGAIRFRLCFVCRSVAWFEATRDDWRTA